ncbi:MAG TPA: hypothetical protein VHB50_19670 [Bryobacteraceae bacterium]|nr:hypothetical protein [Bryobacteraceae bacterium]
MATTAQTLANQTNATLSTGPRTEEGKSASSKNAITHGLFARRGVVRPEEIEAYAELSTRLWAELNPEGALEETLAYEIVNASWRLRRCAMAETELPTESELDPMLDEVLAVKQKSIDRARAQAHNLLRRSTAELRRLQTDRIIHFELFEKNEEPTDTGLASYKEVTATLATDERRKNLKRKNGDRSFEQLLEAVTAPPVRLPSGELASFCTQADSAVNAKAA